MVSKQLQGFMNFIREQGVVGLAVGFILGGSVAKVVTSLVQDIINPTIGVLLGSTEGLRDAAVSIGGVSIHWGNFISVTLDFLIVACVIYFGVQWLGLDKLDKKKN